MKTIKYLLVLLMLVGCGDTIMQAEQNFHPLKNTCWQLYETQRVLVDTTRELLIADTKIVWTITDTTYRFERLLLHDLPNIDSTQVEINDDGHYILIHSLGDLWASDTHSERDFTYVIHQRTGQGWDFVTQSWQTFNTAKAALTAFIINGKNQLQTTNMIYDRCD
jgi:hypothetical protein